MPAPPASAGPPSSWWRRQGPWLRVSLALAALTVAGVVLTLAKPEFTHAFGDTASVWGLWVSLVGFILTVWAVLETQRATREAQEKVAVAVADSRRETKQAVQKIALQLLREECESFSRLIHEAIRASEGQHWASVEEKFQEAQRLTTRLVLHRGLETDEKTVLMGAQSDLEQTVKYARTRRIGKGKTTTALPDTKRSALEKLAMKVEAVLARLRQRVLEPPHVD